MALQKQIILPNGARGNYIKIGSYSWDVLQKEASVHFVLYGSESRAKDSPAHHHGLIAKLRLEGEAFDRHLSTQALAGMDDPGSDPIRTALYRAARTEPLLAGGGLTAVDLAKATDI